MQRRTGRTRDRHGRGPRGVCVLPGPLTPQGTPGRGSRRDRFDAIVLGAVAELERQWSDELGLLEFAVEETPALPAEWAPRAVPLASYLPGEDGAPPRIVLFRRPIELRADGTAELGALVFTVLVEQVSELLGRPPEEIDRRYDAE